MPVVDTRQFKNLPKQRAKRNKAPFLLLLIALGLFGLYGLYQRTRTLDPSPTPAARSEESKEKSPNTRLKNFTAEEFKTLAFSVKYPNTQLFDEPPKITGNKAADARIRQLAEKRGFKLSSIPVTSIVRLNEPRLDLLGDDLLQPLAAESWKRLKSKAVADQIPLSLLSAYRSPEYQRKLFLSRLPATVSEIAAGRADAVIDKTLQTTAPPGYSRHHTGYTIDLWCEDSTGQFVSSSCFRWIKTNNYKIAKETGWVPSYPDGVELQGPEPEPWEYVWVGDENVRE